jgi:thymidylate synthase
MAAKVVGLLPGEFIHTLGDAHLYLNHLDQARTQLRRTPYAAPTLTLADRQDIFAFEAEDVVVENYQHHPAIRAPVAV